MSVVVEDDWVDVRVMELTSAVPAGPVGPVGPPEGPVGPATPWAPAGPVGPWAPVAPVAPVEPVAPVAPAGPVGGATGRIPAFDALRDCRKPLIAAIDGYCVAAGFEISLLCDIRVATMQSQFGLPEPRRSLLAGPGLHYLSRIVPLGEAMLMQLTGSFISAERAHQIGLVQRLAPDRKVLMDEANAIADDILLGAPLAVQAIKRVVRIARNLPPEYSEHFAGPIEEVVSWYE